MILKRETPCLDARIKSTAVRFVFCLKKRTALILVCSEGLATHLDTKKDQHRASPQYCLPRSPQADPLDDLRSACGPAWQRRPGAQVQTPPSIHRAVVWPVGRRCL